MASESADVKNVVLDDMGFSSTIKHITGALYF